MSHVLTFLMICFVFSDISHAKAGLIALREIEVIYDLKFKFLSSVTEFWFQNRNKYFFRKFQRNFPKKKESSPTRYIKAAREI